MNLRCAENFLLVEIEKKFRDKDGSILIDPTWEPEEYATLNGTVYSVPLNVNPDDDRPILGTVQVGDKIWFSYAVIFEYDEQPEFANPVYANLVLHEGKEFWKVHLGEVFCKVDRTGKIEMITDNVLLTPVQRGMAHMEGGIMLLADPADSENKGKVKALPPNIKLSCNVGDVVCIEPKYIQKYIILGSEHYIVRSRRLLAKM